MRPGLSLVRSACLLAAFCLVSIHRGWAGGLPPTDQRADVIKDLHTERTFPEVHSKAEWLKRAKAIREQVQVSCGLWPAPRRTPLHAQIFDRVERGEYSVEKVYFQSFPGFYVAGNLYRPLGKGIGPFPGVLNPHGHWAEGRMADKPEGSIAARCITQARMGMVAFSYDMVGYNDTIQVSHEFAADPTNQLWNINLMGLQTWNSLRAIDFLLTVKEVDAQRLACTGESGGGTQTFILGSLDARLAAQAPVVMVSHTMQGGCLCENAPGLRVEYSNMEFAAVAAPRPQMLVAATGDWTKTTLTVEGPAIAGVYSLMDATNNFRAVRYDFDHNYNQTSREAVYGWFDRWLNLKTESAPLPEPAYHKEPDQELRVWPDGKLPTDALNETALIQMFIRDSQARLDALKPKDKVTLGSYQKRLQPLWLHALKLELPEPKDLMTEAGPVKRNADYARTAIALGRAGRGDRLPALILSPLKASTNAVVILAHPRGKAAFLDAAGEPAGLAKTLLGRGVPVMLLDTFLTGELANAKATTARHYFTNYFTTYNRTDVQERVQDLVTACSYATKSLGAKQVVLCGVDRAGLWALLAAPVADAAVADCATLDSGSDQALMAPDLFFPGVRKLGGFQGAAMLAAPEPLLLHNSGANFPTDGLKAAYAAAEATNAFQAVSQKLSDDAVADWVSKL